MQGAEVRQSQYRHRVAGRVHDAKLADVQPGDVFFLVKNPAIVWGKSEDFEDYPFQPLGNEREFELDEVGQPSDPVVVIHNTLNFPKPGGGGA